jgi:hypothetical protein
VLFPFAFFFLILAGLGVFESGDWVLVWVLLPVVLIFIFVGFGCLRLGQKMVSHENTDG